ncbi:BTB/POZ domain-containing protein 17-like [Ptychodera flava]|uniref:BTB/POZ domain-containing protein 17-like n=1 Tax=Ptychodera flava TaxID=63121 RepID=UPI00396A0DDA
MSKVRVLESKTDMSSSDEETASTSCCGCSDSIQPPKSEETDVEIHGSLVDFADELKSFYNNPTMSDITLKVGNLSFYAHKFMLAKSSDVLQTMLTSSNWGESQQCEVRLEESEECSEKFAEFLQFIYCGKVKFSIQSVLPLLFLADKYNVVDLRTYCSQYMTSKVEKRSVKGAMRWLSYARKFDLDNLSGKCLEVILSQLDSVITTEEWLGLDVDFVCEILQSSDLVVTG